jgi:hypothetical protein
LKLGRALARSFFAKRDACLYGLLERFAGILAADRQSDWPRRSDHTCQAGLPKLASADCSDFRGLHQPQGDLPARVTAHFNRGKSMINFDFMQSGVIA